MNTFNGNSPRPVSDAVQNAQGQWEQVYEIFENNTWVRKKFVHNGVDWQPCPTRTMLDLNKIPDTTAGISLKKSVISLDKSLIDLQKKTGLSLSDHQAKVAVVMDYSGSMSGLYKSGAVQRLLTRLMPIALRFDDNGELDVWLFTEQFARVDSMTLQNFDGYVNNVIKNSGFRMGCTSYAPVLKDVLSKYFVEDNATSNVPTFVIFITDGETSDERKTTEIIRESAYKNIFIQFVGIGDENFRYLGTLDNLTGRPVDNTGFIKISDMDRLNDEQLFTLLLDQYPDWLKNKHI